MRKRKCSIKRAPREVFLVICEGETEKAYAETLKHQYRLPILIKTKIAKMSINQRLVNQYLSEMGLEKDDKSHVFFMYDADVDCIVENLKKLDGTLILSNPCIEVWFILHVKSYRKSIDSSSMVAELKASHPVWARYVKGKFSSAQANCLSENRSTAVERAKQMGVGGNPSSNMYVLIEELETVSNSK